MMGTDQAEIAKLEALYSANPEGRIFAHLADAYRRAGDLVRAREVVEEGLRHHPDYASAHVVLGRISLEEGEIAAAEETFHRVLGLDPENRIALRLLADLARMEGDREAAVRFYEELLLVNPTDQEARGLLDEVRAQGPVGGELVGEELVEEDDGAPQSEDQLPKEGEVTMVDAEDHPKPVENEEVLPSEEEGDDEFIPTIIDDGYDLGLVVTETMGDLYAQQGLTERAAEVYQELLRDRPDDVGLRAKLERLYTTPEPLPIAEDSPVAEDTTLAPMPEDEGDEEDTNDGVGEVDTIEVSTPVGPGVAATTEVAGEVGEITAEPEQETILVTETVPVPQEIPEPEPEPEPEPRPKGQTIGAYLRRLYTFRVTDDTFLLEESEEEDDELGDFGSWLESVKS